jgi:cytochrome P450
MGLPNTAGPSSTEDLPPYPMERRCPFDPPGELVELQNGAAITRVRLWDGSSPWLVTGYDNVRTVLADPRVSADPTQTGYPFSSASAASWRRLSRTFIDMDDPEHAQIRRLLTPDFMVKRAEAMRPKVEVLVNGLIDDMLAGPKPADLVEALALPLPSMVISELLGVPSNAKDLFHKLTRVTLSRMSTAEQAADAVNQMLQYMRELIDAKNADPGDDIVSHLVVSQLQTGQMTRDELSMLIRTLFVAGHETTGNMIALGVVALLANPEVLADLRSADDPTVAAGTVEELLRWLTIMHAGRRRVAREDVEIAGRRIKAGEGIIASLDAANRDPNAFPDPDVLDIHRDARHHVAFGYGVHQCLGQPLARVELQVVFATIFRRIPNLALAVDIAALPFKNDNVVYGVYRLPVTW